MTYLCACISCQKGAHIYILKMNNEVLQVQQSLSIIGRSPLLQQAIAAAVQAAPYDVNVLVLGENGTGKEIFHKILHNYSHRKFKKCIPVNCGALPEGTINSELFGHVKGAYTGATTDRKGVFEEADGGTIFLDEVAELPMETQARLLRVLETGEYTRMGSNEIRKCDVRVVAATNKNLLEYIEQNKFREDLYYRLSTIIIRVPALRQRQEDIHLLFRKFASDIATQYHMPAISLDDNARRILLAYQWPGNVRQLLHLVEELSIVEEERVITAEVLKQHLPHFEARVAAMPEGNSSHENDFGPGEKAMLYKLLFEMKQQLEEVRSQLGLFNSTSGHAHALPPAAPIEDFEEQEAEEVKDFHENEPIVPAEPAHHTPTPKVQTLEEMEKEAIRQALQRNNGSKRKAAEELGISERTIHRKIQDYNL